MQFVSVDIFDSFMFGVNFGTIIFLSYFTTFACHSSVGTFDRFMFGVNFGTILFYDVWWALLIVSCLVPLICEGWREGYIGPVFPTYHGRRKQVPTRNIGRLQLPRPQRGAAICFNCFRSLDRIQTTAVRAVTIWQNESVIWRGRHPWRRGQA